MSKLKPVAIAMVFVMLMPLFSSCSSSMKKSTVVKADDPWYETTKFKLDYEIRKGETLDASTICASDESIFSVYTLATGYHASTRTVLDTYDLYGNRISRKEVTCPSDKRILNVYGITTGSDGKNITAVLQYLEANGNGPIFASIDTETGKLTRLRDLYSKKAKRVKQKESSVWETSFIGDYSIVTMEVSSSTSNYLEFQLLLYKNNDFVCELDLSSTDVGMLMSGFSIDKSIDSIFTAGYEGETLVTLEFDLKSGKLKDKKAFLEADDNKINLADYASTNSGEMCKLDSLGNITMLDVDEMVTKTMVDTNWYTPYFSPFLDSEQKITSTILSCNENRTIIIDKESTPYTSDFYVTNNYIRVLNKADKNPHAGKKVIKLSLPPNSGVTEYLSKAIFEFNKTNSDYLIRIWDKYKTGFNLTRFNGTPDEEKQVYTMIQDLKGGDAPDIIIGIQKKYAMRDDIFMDLTGILDPEVMEKQYKNVFEAAKVDGKQFFFPVTLQIEGLVTNKDLLKEGAVGITFEEYEKIIKDKMKGFSPYDYPGSWSHNKRTFILSCIDTKSAIEGEKIDFGTEQFRAAVKYAKDNIQYNDEASIPGDSVHDYNRFRGECYYSKINDYLDYVHACFSEEGQYNIIGTPSVNASGPRFKALETISVSASTGEKDGCKKFLNFLFAGSAYKSEEPEFRQIVTNREIMERNTVTTGKLNNKGYDNYRDSVESGSFVPVVGLDKATGDKTATEDMRILFLNSLSNLSTYYYEDAEITKFVFEEIAPYFTGDHTLDEAITVLNDRATKYTREL